MFHEALEQGWLSVRVHDISAYLVDAAFPLPSDIDSVLDAAELASARRFQHHADRVRAVLSRYLIRQALGNALRLAPEKIRFSYGPFGKPLLAFPLAKHRHFNISHGGARIAIALSPTPVGVDIEPQASFGDVTDLARQFLAGDEMYDVLKAGGLQQSQEFLYHWTRKEAVLKAHGLGLHHHPKSFSARLDHAPGRHWNVRSISTVEGHSCAVAWLVASS